MFGAAAGITKPLTHLPAKFPLTFSLTEFSMLNALPRRALLAASLAMAVALAGCGSKDEPKKAVEKKAEVAKSDPLKIGFIYVGPTGDAGWTFAHDNARKAVEQEFGDRVKTSFVESVPEGPDSERVEIGRAHV